MSKPQPTIEQATKMLSDALVALVQAVNAGATPAPAAKPAATKVKVDDKPVVVSFVETADESDDDDVYTADELTALLDSPNCEEVLGEIAEDLGIDPDEHETWEGVVDAILEAQGTAAPKKAAPAPKAKSAGPVSAAEIVKVVSAIDDSDNCDAVMRPVAKRLGLDPDAFDSWDELAYEIVSKSGVSPSEIDADGVESAVLKDIVLAYGLELPEGRATAKKLGEVLASAGGRPVSAEHDASVPEDDGDDEDDEELTEDELRAMALPELKALAKEYGIAVPRSVTKDELIEAFFEEE